MFDILRDEGDMCDTISLYFFEVSLEFFVLIWHNIFDGISVSMKNHLLYCVHVFVSAMREYFC